MAWTLAQFLAVPDLFWNHVHEDSALGSYGGEPCRVYRKRTHSDYRKVAIDRNGKYSSIPSHRLAMILVRGEDIPSIYEVDHLCKNKPCCNPSHLEVVSRVLNTRRAFRWRQNSNGDWFCGRGHKMTASNTIKHATGVRCRRCQDI